MKKFIVFTFIITFIFSCKKENVDPNVDKHKPNSNVDFEVESSYFKYPVQAGVNLNVICNLTVKDVTAGTDLFKINSCNLLDTSAFKQYAAVMFKTTDYHQYKFISEARFIYSKKEYTPVNGLFHNINVKVNNTSVGSKSISLSKVNDSTYISTNEITIN
jgi:hypothetical protein